MANSRTPWRQHIGLVLLLSGAVALVVIIARVLPFLSLASVHAHRAWLVDAALAHPVAAPLLFFTLYVAFVILPVPGIGLLTIVAGALFGLGEGIVVVSFASSIGATLAFLLSRRWLRAPMQRRLQRRFGGRLEMLSRGIETEGAFYLFALRLMPVAPFFLINLLMGLTTLPAFTFYWVSQIGMLPATIAYVNTGLRLAEVHTLSGLVSASVLASFAALGLMPLIARHALHALRRLRGTALPQNP